MRRAGDKWFMGIKTEDMCRDLSPKTITEGIDWGSLKQDCKSICFCGIFISPLNEDGDDYHVYYSIFDSKGL